MTLACRSDEPHPLADALLADLGIAPGTLERAIDERDEMLEFLAAANEGDRERALCQYFRSGASIADSLAQVLSWRFGDLGRVGKLLDFASGYGRVTRFLVREIPPQRLWVADVDAEAVRFQQERFGVQGLVSTLRPEELSCGERFDAVLVTSLFTHLPEERFVAWLRVLLGLLAPGGMLVFSAHSPELLPGAEAPDAGIRFQATSESGSLAASDYGSTWVTEDFVRAALAKAAGADVSLHRLARGLCDFQDLYLAISEPEVGFSSLSFHGEPQLFLESAELAPDGRLALAGWAAVRCGAVRAVEAVLDGERLAAAPVAEPRPDVAALLGGERHLRSGWLCSLPLPAAASRSASILLLRAVDARGAGHPLWIGSLEAVLLVSSRNEATRLRRELRHAEAVHAEERARAAVEAEALRARIAAMQASRFWKLRNAWFRLKKLVGLVEDAG
jgi:SAM-dependent methyltransferase